LCHFFCYPNVADKLKMQIFVLICVQSFLSITTNQPYYNIPAVGASAHEVLCIAESAVCQSEHAQDI